MPGVGVLVSEEGTRPEKTFWVRQDIFRELLEADSHEISRSDSATSTGEQMSLACFAATCQPLQSIRCAALR